MAIPQADEQQRLLAHLVEQMVSAQMPLPRFWYLPRGAKAAVVMTGDDHGNGGTAGRFDQELADSPAGCNVANWECVRSTSYVYANTPITDQQAAGYASQGFEIGLHPTTGCNDWTPASLASTYTTELGDWHAAFPSLASPTTNRTHCIVESDYSTPAAGRARQRHPPRHELLLLAGELDPGPSRPVHRLGLPDALRRRATAPRSTCTRPRRR